MKLLWVTCYTYHRLGERRVISGGTAVHATKRIENTECTLLAVLYIEDSIEERQINKPQQ